MNSIRMINTSYPETIATFKSDNIVNKLKERNDQKRNKKGKDFISIGFNHHQCIHADEHKRTRFNASEKNKDRSCTVLNVNRDTIKELNTDISSTFEVFPRRRNAIVESNSTESEQRSSFQSVVSNNWEERSYYAEKKSTYFVSKNICYERRNTINCYNSVTATCLTEDESTIGVTSKICYRRRNGIVPANATCVEQDMVCCNSKI